MFEAVRTWAKALKRDAVALWLAARDRRVSVAAKIFAGAVAAYALSPIDLIPDFVPVLGYLDDLIIVPLGIMLVVRLVPKALMDEFRAEAQRLAEKPVSRVAMVLIVAAWVLAGWFLLRWLGLVPVA
jgi:uncharacterized membrane protein YkvA (DUF1232 family)